ncbi:Protein CBR-SRT-43 [Caenorhabditis briggsae]|uniref:Protein CBR-SRT-43 n=2 Tax=Caenorhabditis briggsae TaxID=6238 RepID=A8X723_CAEBR|nr:Protein CBR-SRT-43 [Caenorhabditis briggsae]ULT88569.1 hypothetical protein L3Y34_007640 [Caenorhabditis briggsae]CAP28434.2 Protein CBR-SRT-43 [Caenorhabditis briggsae]
MNRIIQYGSVEGIPYYNCSAKTSEEWFATGLQRPLFGWTILIFGIVIEMFYIPTIYMMFRTKLVHMTCYKIIVCLGVTDMLATLTCSIFSGWLFIQGAVFCNYPTFIYLAGMLGLSGWCMACGSTLLLVVNRVIDVLYRPLSEFLFDGKRVFFSIALIVAYGLIVATFSPSIIFNSVIMAWIADPLTIDPEYKTEDISDFYRNHVQSTNNWIFVSCTCSLYTVYCVLVNKMQRGQKSKASRSVFIQSSIICSFNTFAAMCYNAMVFIPPPPWVVVIGELCWSLVHGCPAIIYLTMNRTIRSEFLKFLKIKKPNKKVTDISSTSNMRHTGMSPTSN